MAEQTEIKKVITVDVGNTATSLKEYKKHIDDLRASLLGLDSASEEYDKIAKEIKAEQDKLNEVMKVGKKDTDAAEGSYNALVNTMAELKKQWRATADETERAELGKKINSVNDQLKNLDASTGNFQRNVGNYEGGFSKAMQGLAGGIKGAAIPAVSGLGKAFTALAANPVGAVIAALGMAITALSKAMKGNEETSNRMRIALSAFEPIINLIKKAFDLLAKRVVETFEAIGEAIQKTLEGISSALHWLGWDEWAGKIDNYLEKAQQAVNLSEREVQLSIDKRQNSMREAEIQRDISELRAKMADKDSYTADQRMAFLTEWENKEKELANIKLKQAKDEYDLIKDRNSLTANSAADNQAEADAYVNLMNAQREYNEGLRSVNKQKTALLNEINGITTAASRQSTVVTKAIDDIRKQADTIQERLRKATMSEQDLLEETYLNEKATLEAAGRDTEELTRQYNKALTDINTKALEENYNATKTELEQELGLLTRSNEQKIFEIQYLAEYEKLTEEEKAQLIFDIQQQELQDKLNVLEQEYIAANGLADEQERIMLEIDNLSHQMMNNQIKRDAELSRAHQKELDKRKAMDKAYQLSAIKSAGAIFGTLASLFEEGTEEYKAFATTETIINGLAAVIGTLNGYSTLGPWGEVAAIAKVASIVASTAATVAKIQSASPNSSGGDVSAAAGQASASVSMAGATPLLNEDYDINRMSNLNQEPNSNREQQNMKVYVVESDIADATHKVEVRENNATY